MFQIQYDRNWHENEYQDGGYSLEMIDLNNYCTGQSNWASSKSAAGGTPGRTNSVMANNPDTLRPNLTNVLVKSSDSIILEFNEFLKRSQDFEILLNGSLLDYSWANSYTINAFPNFVLDANFKYNLALQNVSDCAGNQ